MSIGALSKDTGVKVPTIRFYEQIGLLRSADRTQSNRRIYDAKALERLRFIRHARDLGFSVDAIRQLIELADEAEKPCRDIDRIAAAHLADIDGKIRRLRSLRREVARMLESCGHGRVGECRIIEVLANHRLCNTEH